MLVPAHPSAPVLPRERVSRWDLGLAPVLPTGKAPPMARVSERDSVPDQALVLAQVRAKALHSGSVRVQARERVLVWELLVACSIVPSEPRPVLLSCRAAGRC